MRRKTRIILIAGLLGTVLSAPASEATEKLSRLKVSDNGRFLVKEDRSPFFWLGDTAWNLFQRTSLEDEPNQPGIERYFAARARQGFTVIQATLIMGIKPNVYGQHPFTAGDSPRTNVKPGPDNDYWDVADRLIDFGEKHGLYMALLPIWLSSLNDRDPIVRDPKVAYRYGRFLGNRYGKRTHIIWVLGGDPWGKGKDVDNPIRLAMTRALAEGIADGVNGIDRQDGKADWSTTLMTFHPKGGHHSSSELLHAEPWLDFNMIQTTTHFSVHNYETVATDYGKMPVKPTLDGEVAYENSRSLRKNEPQDRRITPSDVRRAAYWAVFAGGFGHTYGHRSFIQWTRKGENTGRGGDVPWYEVLDSPAANQMRHLRALIESRPFLSRVPDQGLLAGRAGTGIEHVRATRGDGYAFIYTSMGRPVSVKLGIISGKTVRASWFDPRTGNTEPAGAYANSGTREFAPPGRPGPGDDWVLVLDDSARDFPRPAEPVERFGFYSAKFKAAGQYDNPYNELHALAILHCPDGETRNLPLFWDGGDCWRLRISPDAVGTWRFTVRSPDKGLDGRTGQFECITSDRKGSILPMQGFSHHFRPRRCRPKTG